MNKELINSAIAKITEEALSIKDAFSQMIEEYLTDICKTDAVATKLLDENKSLKAFCDEMWKEAKSRSAKCAAGSGAYISDKECFEKAEAYYEITEEDKRTKNTTNVIDITELL